MNIPFRENHPAHTQLHNYVSRKYDCLACALVPLGPVTRLRVRRGVNSGGGQRSTHLHGHSLNSSLNSVGLPRFTAQTQW